MENCKQKQQFSIQVLPYITNTQRVEPSTTGEVPNTKLLQVRIKDLTPFFCSFTLSLTRFDHLIAIERAGMAADGNYYNARKVNIKNLVDPIDDLFLAAQTIPGVTTTGMTALWSQKQEKHKTGTLTYWKCCRSGGRC